jgi:D-alanine-D-alanine ligase
MSYSVAVLMGGASAEAEVSRASAKEVASALEQRGHRADLLELNSETADHLARMRPQVVFPALHGPPGEDGTVQGFLEILGFPYVGSGVHGSAVAMDKALAKAVFRDHKLPVAEHIQLASDADAVTAARQVEAKFGTRVVVKPLGQGSAIGVTPLANGGDLQPALKSALSYGGGALIEPYVLGREITVGVLDLEGESAQALPVIEIRTAGDQWYDFHNRYTVGSSEHIIPAPLGEKINQELQEIALSAHRSLGLTDLSRADFIVTDSDDIVLLEVNTMPGMTPTSLFPDGARAIGISFPELMERLVASALRRARTDQASAS